MSDRHAISTTSIIIQIRYSPIKAGLPNSFRHAVVCFPQISESLSKNLHQPLLGREGWFKPTPLVQGILSMKVGDLFSFEKFVEGKWAMTDKALERRSLFRTASDYACT